uniref:Uncharacterized protein n=1 Tax=Acrobeloides nanus TaxID=290746 RepID=A0A914DLU0_9BILA
NLLIPKSCQNETQKSIWNGQEDKFVHPFVGSRYFVIAQLIVILVLTKTPELWTNRIYKQIFHLGLYNLFDIWLRMYYVSAWGIWYGPVSRRYLFAGLNGTSIGITILTFGLALNRWEVLAWPKLFFKFNTKGYLDMLIIVLSYLIGIGLFILQILPGYGRFMVYVNVPSGPFLEAFQEYQGGKIIDYQFYAEQSLMIASVLLYAYCIIVIVYERLLAKIKQPRKELLLFVQTFFPCIMRILANEITSYYYASGNLYLIGITFCWILESCHYPFLYFLFNRSIRKAIGYMFFKNNASSIGIGVF